MTKFQYLKESLKDCDNLCRVGGFRDGGYVLPFSAIINADTLISGGVGSNARFEIDVLDINPKIKLFPIDLSFSILRMFARTFYHFFKKNTNWKVSLIENFTVLILIEKFNIIKKFINKTFDFSNIEHYLSIKSNKIIVKLDIEESEYEILESLLSFEEKIEAICIEFHNLEKKENYDFLQIFLNKTTLELIYVSVNESSIVNGEPNILEISLCKSKNLINKMNYLQASYNPETTLLTTL